MDRQEVYKQFIQAKKAGMNSPQSMVFNALWAEIQNVEKAQQTEITEDGIQKLLYKQHKQLQETLDGFKKRGSEDDNEKIDNLSFRLAIIDGMLPKQLNTGELYHGIATMIMNKYATNNDMPAVGTLIRDAIKEFAGRATNDEISKVTKQVYFDMK